MGLEINDWSSVSLLKLGNCEKKWTTKYDHPGPQVIKVSSVEHPELQSSSNGEVT